MLRAERGLPVGRPQASFTAEGTGPGQPFTSADGTGGDSARRRQARKDDAIRKKLEVELGKKKRHQRNLAADGNRSRAGNLPRAHGTVSALRPSPAITVEQTSSVVDAAQLMAAKRCDCVLVTNSEGALSGIFTDKDLAYRVVAEGLDPRVTPIAQVMTPNPDCCTDTAMATDALAQMASGGYRHLPVQDESGDIVGVLDITRCLYEALEKLERANGDSQRLVDAVAIMDSFAGATPQAVTDFVNRMREKMACPSLASVIRPDTCPNDLNVRESVREAVRIMKAFHQTAVLATESGRLAGIFTTKDCVVRVVAAGLDPGSTSLVRVMTPHPDTASTDMTILQALHKMHSSRYLHLPVVNGANGLIGMADVLQLTYAMLEQIRNMSTAESDGPMWNKFWQSTTFIAEDTASVHSASVSEFAAREFSVDAGVEGAESVHSDALQDITWRASQPEEATALGIEARLKSPSVSSSSPLRAGPGAHQASVAPEEAAFDEAGYAFVFKFRERSGAVHRFTVTNKTTMAELLGRIRERANLDDDGANVGSLRQEAPTNPKGEVVPAVTGRTAKAIKISYLDDENDQIVLAKDEDLLDAVQVAKKCGWPVMPLFVSVRKEGGEWESLGMNDEKAIESELMRRRRASERLRRDGKPSGGGKLPTGLEGFLLPCAIGIGVAVVAFIFFKQMSK